MADNYLEKKYEDLRNGRNIIKRVNPSLDSLLSRTAVSASASDPSYKVRKAQLDAMLGSAARLGYDCEARCDESKGELFISCKDSVCLGRLCLAAELKAAELKLSTSTQITKDADEGSLVSAIIQVFR